MWLVEENTNLDLLLFAEHLPEQKTPDLILPIYTTAYP